VIAALDRAPRRGYISTMVRPAASALFVVAMLSGCGGNSESEPSKSSTGGAAGSGGAAGQSGAAGSASGGSSGAAGSTATGGTAGTPSSGGAPSCGLPAVAPGTTELTVSRSAMDR